MKQHGDHVSKSVVFPFMIIVAILLYGICQPGHYTDQADFLFFYPIYGDPTTLTFFTNGSWIIIYGLEYVMYKEANYVSNKEFFRFFTSGSLFIYLCHDLWITVVATFIIHPNSKDNNPRAEGLSLTMNLFIMFFAVEFLCNLHYYLIVRLLKWCYKKKKRG